MSSAAISTIGGGGYASQINTADYNIAATTWDSFDGNGWRTFGASNGNVFLVNGLITVRTQAANTLARVTVKVMVAYGTGTYTLLPVLSAEAILPAISGVNGVATIPLDGLFTTSGLSGSTYFVVEVYSTAAITVKATVPDNATGNIAGPFGASYANNPTANASYVNLIGLK
jgi:hypothetical protein